MMKQRVGKSERNKKNMLLTRQKGTKGFLYAVCTCLVGAAFVLTLLVEPALAEDDENIVNPQQRPDSSFIYDTSIASLDEADSFYDEQTVQVVGEAVGDSIRQGLSGKHRWVTLTALEKEVAATVSVYMREESAAKIDSYGKYGVTGTVLQVRGTFQLVCPEHEGLTDLHAEIVTVVEKGKHHGDVFDPKTFIPGALFVAVGLALMGLYYYLRERQR